MHQPYGFDLLSLEELAKRFVNDVTGKPQILDSKVDGYCWKCVSIVTSAIVQHIKRIGKAHANLLSYETRQPR